MAGVATLAIVVSTWDRNGAITSTASGLALGFVDAGFESVPDTPLLTFAVSFRAGNPGGGRPVAPRSYRCDLASHADGNPEGLLNSDVPRG
jgi:hypothetical protein